MRQMGLIGLARNTNEGQHLTAEVEEPSLHHRIKKKQFGAHFEIGKRALEIFIDLDRSYA